ncbi:MAG: glycosyltransferase family 2 protein [Cyclobacteriaceae bacterium]
MESAAIIILNYNGVHFLEQFLPSVVASSAGHRLIVADNASTDASLEFLQKNYPTVEIFAFEENYGFAEGYNQALNLVDNTYSILLNSDVEVTPGWIEPVLNLMEQDVSIAACQPKVKAFHQKSHFEHAGAAGGYIDQLGYPFCRGRIIDLTEEDKGQYDNIVPIFWATGACFFVRTQVYKSMGGFDASFFAHMEEIDFCWRLQRAGYKLYYHPQSVVYHVGGGTMPATNPRKTYLNFRNSTVMLYKNEKIISLLWKLPAKLGLDLLAMLYFRIQGKSQDGQAVWRAVVDFLGKFRQWKRPANHIQLVNRSTPFVMMKSLLVWERYFHGKKYFRELSFANRFNNTRWDSGFSAHDAEGSSKKQYQDTAKWASQKLKKKRK